MRKCLILILILAVAFPVGMVDAEKKNNHHRRENRAVIVIADYTASQWDGVIQETVDDFNAIMPKRGPRLVYARKDSGSCPEGVYALVVCTGPMDSNNMGQAWTTAAGSVILINDMYLGPEFSHAFPIIACHELMHIVANVGDNPGAFPDESCVWGELSDPGPKDGELLRKNYSKDTKDRNKKR